MTTVFFVMHFDIAPIVVWIFELPLDQEIRAASVIRILLGLECGLVVVAIAKDRSGYVVGVTSEISTGGGDGKLGWVSFAPLDDPHHPLRGNCTGCFWAPIVLPSERSQVSPAHPSQIRLPLV